MPKENKSLEEDAVQEETSEESTEPQDFLDVLEVAGRRRLGNGPRPLTVMHIPISIILPIRVAPGASFGVTINFNFADSGMPVWVDCSDHAALAPPTVANGNSVALGGAAWPRQFSLRDASLNLSIVSQQVTDRYVRIYAYRAGADPLSPTALGTISIGAL